MRRADKPRLLLAPMLATLLVLSACGSTEVEPAFDTAEALEAEVYTLYGEDYQARVSALIGECARLNGLQQWNASAVPQQTKVEVAPHLSGDERTAAIGSGMIAGALEAKRLREAALEELAERASNNVDEISEEARILDYGPVDTPNGETFGSGCRQWAAAMAESDPSFVEATERADFYSEYLADRLSESVEIVTLQSQWSTCMADHGYAGLESQGAQLDLIAEARQDWEAGSRTYESALSFDVAITTAAVDCNRQVDPELRRIRNDIATSFASENPGMFPGG